MAVIIVPMGHVSGSDGVAHKIACDNLFKLYDAKTATVQQMQEYASCVKLVYPNNDPVAMKAIVFLLLLSAVIGGVIGYIKRYDFMYGEWFMATLAGGFLGAFAFMLVAMICAAIGFVLS